jgi:hypothetical protein
MARRKGSIVVGVFGAMRLAIGTAALVAPRRFDRQSQGALMTRSFAVRELVLGVGGLSALSPSSPSPGLATWAGLGALTDAGDLGAAVAAFSRRESSSGLSALVAAVGLAAESSAWLASRDHRHPHAVRR